MDHWFENNASKRLENRPKESSHMQLNGDTEFHDTQNAGALNSGDAFNHDKSSFGLSNMSAVNPTPSPVCENLLGNLEEKSQSHVELTTDNGDNTMNTDSLFSNLWNPQMLRSSFNSEGNMDAEVQSQVLEDANVFASLFHDDTVNSEDASKFSSLFGDVQAPQGDINTTNYLAYSDVQQHSRVGTTPSIDTACVQNSRGNGNNLTSGASKFNAFHFPQSIPSNARVGGNEIAGIQKYCHGGTVNAKTRTHGVKSNHEMTIPSLFNNQGPQAERSSINIGINRPHTTRRNSRVGASIGTSRVQGARSNTDSFRNVVTQSHYAQNPQINQSSVQAGDRRAPAIHPQRRVETGPGGSHLHGVTIDGNNDTGIPTIFNNLQGHQINRSPTSIEGGLASKKRAHSQYGNIEAPNLGSNALLLNETDSSMNDRDFLSVGNNVPEVLLSQVQKSSVRNNVTTDGNQFNSTNQSNSAVCPEQIDSFLNLGVGGNATVGLQSNAIGGIPSNNGCPVITPPCIFDGPQNDGNFLSLGGNMGDQTWSNNANKITSGTNLGVNYSTYMSHGGNTGNQTGSNNGSRTILGNNVGVHSNPITSSQTVQGVLRPSARTLGPGGNGVGVQVKEVPYMGFHGHSGVSLRPFNSIPSGLRANEQARLSSLPLRPSYLTGFPGGPFSVPNMDNIRRLSMRPSTIGATARTLEPAQSGHPVPVNITTEAAKEIIDLSDDSKLSKTDQGTSHSRRRGKRVPADGMPYPQSAKVLLAPSVSGKPVPVSGRVGLARPSEGLHGQTIQSNNIHNASATLRAPRGRKILHQPTIKPSPASGNPTNAVYHLKWTGLTESSNESSGENCHLCKRDLTYTATGPVTQPPVPPPVAVLPCGHAFHDECLQRITPDDQLKDPPCIPCAIGPS